MTAPSRAFVCPIINLSLFVPYLFLSPIRHTSTAADSIFTRAKLGNALFILGKIMRTILRLETLSCRSIGGLILLAALASLFLVGCSKPEQRTIVVLGDVSGQYRQIGESVRLGAQFAALNLPNLPDGTKLTVRVVNDRGDVENARTEALKAIADPSVLAVIGHSTSGTTGAAIDVYGPQAMPLFMPVATNPNLTISAKKRGWSNLYRLVPPDVFQAAKIAEFCASKQLSAKTVVVLYDSSPYGQTLGNSLRIALSNQKIDVPKHLLVEPFIPGRTDYKRITELISPLAPDVIVFAGYYREGGALVKDLRAYGFSGPIILTDGCFPMEILREVGPKPSPLYVSFVAPVWNSVPNAAGLLDWARKIEPNTDLSYTPFATDSMYLIHKGATDIVSRGHRLDRNSLLSYLQENRDFHKELIAAPYRFNDEGDNVLGRNYIYQFTEGTDGKRAWGFKE